MYIHNLTGTKYHEYSTNPPTKNIVLLRRSFINGKKQDHVFYLRVEFREVVIALTDHHMKRSKHEQFPSD